MKPLVGGIMSEEWFARRVVHKSIRLIHIISDSPKCHSKSQLDLRIVLSGQGCARWSWCFEAQGPAGKTACEQTQQREDLKLLLLATSPRQIKMTFNIAAS